MNSRLVAFFAPFFVPLIGVAVVAMVYARRTSARSKQGSRPATLPQLFGRKEFDPTWAFVFLGASFAVCAVTYYFTRMWPVACVLAGFPFLFFVLAYFGGKAMLTGVEVHSGEVLFFQKGQATHLGIHEITDVEYQEKVSVKGTIYKSTAIFCRDGRKIEVEINVAHPADLVAVLHPLIPGREN